MDGLDIILRVDLNMQVILPLFLVAVTSSVYVKEVMQSETALCLDGSPSAIFVSKGDPERILIHF